MSLAEMPFCSEGDKDWMTNRFGIGDVSSKQPTPHLDLEAIRQRMEEYPDPTLSAQAAIEGLEVVKSTGLPVDRSDETVENLDDDVEVEFNGDIVVVMPNFAAEAERRRKKYYPLKREKKTPSYKVSSDGPTHPFVD